MKKILSYCLVATIALAMALMMVGCGGDEPHLKNFKVEFTGISQTYWSYTITPATDEETYATRLVTKKELEMRGLDDITAGKWKESYTGEQDFKSRKLYPASDYVVIVFPVSPSPGNPGYWERTGDAEYIFFSTQDWPNRMDGEIPNTQNGKVHQTNTLIHIDCMVLGDEQLHVYLWTTNPKGRFTKKDFFAYAGDYVSRYQGCPIYDIDFTGKYDAETNKYIYEGWFRMSNEQYSQGIRYSFKLACDLVKE